jgi:hypothetical protein
VISRDAVSCSQVVTVITANTGDSVERGTIGIQGVLGDAGVSPNDVSVVARCARSDGVDGLADWVTDKTDVSAQIISIIATEANSAGLTVGLAVRVGHDAASTA